jgi:hypothetical protein
MRNYHRYRPRSWLLVLALIALVAMAFAFRPSEPTELSFIDTPAVLVDVGDEAPAFAGQVTDAVGVTVASFENLLNAFLLTAVLIAVAVVAVRITSRRHVTFNEASAHDHYTLRRLPAVIGGTRPLLT